MVEALLIVLIVLVLVLLYLVWTSRSSKALTQSMESVTERIERTVREENKNSRSETGDTFSRFQRELKDDLSREQTRSAEDFKNFNSYLKETFDTFSKTQKEAFESSDKTQKDTFKAFDDTLKDRFNQMAQYTREQNDKIVLSLKENATTLDTNLKDIREKNEQQLEKMRQTVDEKLQTTLEKRLTESFKRVTDQLETVHKGLGEMQSLAVNVGDLKNVLTNVKIRGTWGEYQLGNILEQMLSPEQYEKNAHPSPSNSKNVVEYAVKMPGKTGDDTSIYLPIDSKFPKEDYEALINASETGDAEKVAAARKNLLNRVKTFAKEIHDKYIEPPYTTTFAIMFMPIEGIYAEVLREPGFFEDLQRTYKVTITGPTTLAAFLNSLQMGFRTIAISKQSDMIWKTLSAVKTEFGNFSGALEQAYKQVSTAQGTLEKLKGTRVRVMNSKLKGLETLDAQEAQNILEIDEAEEIEYTETEK
ncbi:MAG: DNA recombination protein RmuC [Flavobacteriales bacterium]|nr:DNA recombination protein RmuC [Flavobacteriales bacterium]